MLGHFLFDTSLCNKFAFVFAATAGSKSNQKNAVAKMC